MTCAITQGHPVFTCDICGAMASFGFGVRLRAALAAREQKQVDRARKLIGRWYCAEHKTCETEKEISA